MTRNLLITLGTAALLLALGSTMNANAGLFGLGGDSWKEEVLLHDGSTLIVKRSLSYRGRPWGEHDAPVREQSLSFTLPSGGKTIEWKVGYDPDVGRVGLKLLALHVLEGTPYVVATPNLCLAYNKWGRPNPPYVIFVHDGTQWQRIPIERLPLAFKTLNVAIYLGQEDVDAMVKAGVTSAKTITRRNNQLTQPEYKTILREPTKHVCREVVTNGKGLWLSIDAFSHRPTLDKCLERCKREGFDSQHCPCNRLFKGE